MPALSRHAVSIRDIEKIILEDIKKHTPFKPCASKEHCRYFYRGRRCFIGLTLKEEAAKRWDKAQSDDGNNIESMLDRHPEFLADVPRIRGLGCDSTIDCLSELQEIHDRLNNRFLTPIKTKELEQHVKEWAKEWSERISKKK